MIVGRIIGGTSPAIDKELSTESENAVQNKAIAQKVFNLELTKIDGAYADPQGYLYLTSNGDVVEGPIGPFAGGSGGGSSNNATITLTNTSGWIYKTTAYKGSCVASINWSSLENEISTGPGILKITVNNAVKATMSVEQGDLDIELKNYLSAGSNTVKLIVSDIYGNTKSLFLNVAAISVSLESPFDGTVPYTGDISYPYIPTGDVEKTIHFILDKEEIGTATVTTSGRQLTFTIPAQLHGSHTFEVYFEATIDEDTITSNKLYYDLMCTETGNNTVIISCPFVASEVEQYTAVGIPYSVYNPASLTSEITLEENGDEVNSLTVDRTQQTWSYRPGNYGSVILSIVCGDVRKDITIPVIESTIPVYAETELLSLYLPCYGRSNNEENPDVWVYNDITTSFTDFNFVTDGWQLDEDSNTVMRVSGDARLEINYKLFESDFRTSGKTIEIEFATRDVLNYDAVMLSCMSGGRGIEFTTQETMFASEQSSIGTGYKEEEHIRITFVVEKRSGNKLLLCYINGIMSGACIYSDDDDFSQINPVNITIGSNECTTDIYCIRVYDNDLTRYQVLDNWIADTQNGNLRKDRYERNNIYDSYGKITIDTLKKDVPYLVINAPVLPQFKGDKKTCSGYYVDPVNTKNSFEFEDAEIDVQGTSSQYYYVKNYKIKFKGGFILANGTSVEVYKMNDEAVPTSVFTFKADVASSEGGNNVVLAKLYNELCPVLTPPQEEDSCVRQTIDGHPIVIFWDNGTDSPKFVGKYNFNNDKGTKEVFGFAPGDESWEILQNGTDRVAFRSADFSTDDWKNDFEARYPEDNTDTSKLEAFTTWIMTTDTDAATNETFDTPVSMNGVEFTADTKEYRLAKFVQELPDYADVDALVFYYVFTEIFLCIDQREKNAFPTWFADMGVMIMLFYDADSSLGTDNKGNLAFDYYLEDIDYTEAGDPVYNGQNSLLWVNIRKGFYDKIAAEYRRLRTDIRSDGSGLPLISYDVVNNMFESHQGIWSEAIYNEDGFKKCLEPYILDNDTLYIGMLQGKKEQHRKWWLYNRFRYLDSKHVIGTSMEIRITIRAHAQANIWLTSYVNMYGHVYYNAEMVEHRMTRGTAYEFVWSATGAEDAVIGINDADMLTSIGDLAPLMVELVDISPATHLTSLKVGDSAADYVNDNLTSVTLGNNTLLRYIDFRNCVSLEQAVDASGCINLEEAYFDGTAITSLKLANGCGIKTLHLPETITSLTMMNLSKLEEFVIPSYANITTLRLENNSSVIDPIVILYAIPENSRVRIIGFDITVDSVDDIFEFYDKFDTMRGLDENNNNMDNAQVSGMFRIDSITGAELAEMMERYPTVTIAYNHITSYLYYYNYDGSSLLYTESITDGANGTYSSTPSRVSTAQYNYTFAGWSLSPNGEASDKALTAVTADRKVYAAYITTIRTYNVYYYNGSTLLGIIENVPYGGSVSYIGDDPVYRGDDAEDWGEFIGFMPDGSNITGETKCYAQYKYLGTYTRELIQRTIDGIYRNETVEKDRGYTFYNCSSLTSVDFPNATNIGNYTFYNCSKLVSVNIPLATSIGFNAFQNCSALTSVDFTNATSIGESAFNSCSALTSVNIPLATGIGKYAFQKCSSLISVNIPLATSIGSKAFEECNKVTSLDFPNVISMENYGLSCCRKAVSINLPNLTTVGNYGIYRCESLASIDLPKVTKISQYMLQSCYKLVSVDTSNATSIEYRAFYECYSLTAVIIRSETLCTLSNTNAFQSCTHFLGTVSSAYNPDGLKDGYIYVPSALIESYKTATNWSTYASQFRALEDYTVDGTITGALDESKI